MPRNAYSWFGAADLAAHGQDALWEAMNDQPYSPSGPVGFTLGRRTRNHINGAFVLREQFEQIVTDPLGVEHSIQGHRVQTARFRLSQRCKLLELTGSARAGRHLLSWFATQSSQEVVVTPLAPPMAWWVQELPSSFSGTRVVAAELRHIRVEGGVEAAIRLTGESGVLREARRHSSDLSDCARLSFRIRTNGAWKDIEITSRGRILVEADDSSILRKLRTIVATFMKSV